MRQGYLFAAPLKLVSSERFISYVEDRMGRNVAHQILAAYGIRPNMDKNLFWGRLTFLVGDAMFSSMSVTPVIHPTLLIPVIISALP